MTPTTEAGRACMYCGHVLDEPYPEHRRWRCPDVLNRADIRDAARAMGLPTDTALWKMLDVVSKRAVAAERARLAEAVRGLHRYHLGDGVEVVGYRGVLALLEPEP